MSVTISTEPARAHIGDALSAAVPARRAMVVLSFGALLVGYILWQTQPVHLSSLSYLYGEGVYAQTAWAVQRGHRLFEEVFASQPPLLTYLTAAAFTYAGPSAPVARLTVVVLSVAALIGVALPAARVGGWRAGLGALALLALSESFSVTARRILPDVPAMSFASLAVGFAAVYAVDRRRVWWVAACAAFALATLTKLIVLPVAVPLAILLIGAHGRRLAPLGLIVDLGILAGVVLLAWGPLLLAVDPMKALDQLVIYRARTRVDFPLDLPTNLGLLRKLVTADPVPWIFAALGVGALWTAPHRLVSLACLVWLVVAWIALVAHSPLFRHHIILALPPAAILGGIGLLQALAATIRAVRARALKRDVLTGGIAVCALALAAVALPRSLASHLDGVRRGNESRDDVVAAAAALQSLTQPESAIVTDDPMIALVAGRSVPPSLVDTSYVRIRAGYLTSQQVQEVVESADSAAILLWSDRFDSHLPNFRPWIRRNARHERSFGPGRDLYLKPSA